MSISAEAWFIHAAKDGERGCPAELVRETYEFDDLEPDEVLLAPLFGSWEGNMGHALARDPVDVCAARGYERAVIGNSGTARVLDVGAEVRGLCEGQTVLMAGMEADTWGYPKKLMAFDAPIHGLMTTRMKLRADWVIPIPDNTRFDLSRWAAFNVRYLTAWDNWRLAYGTFRLLLNEEEFPCLNVWSWGGGAGLAEAQLACLFGHTGVALASTPERLKLVERLGVKPIDRTAFPELQYDEKRYRSDKQYVQRFRDSEAAFLETVRRETDGLGVQIFVDMIGEPVFRSTVKALGRQGVIASAGWKAGMRMQFLRAVECIERHQFVHTHFTRTAEARDAVEFAEEREWLPIVDERIYSFDEIPELAADYAAGKFVMFPCYQINAE